MSFDLSGSYTLKIGDLDQDTNTKLFLFCALNHDSQMGEASVRAIKTKFQDNSQALVKFRCNKERSYAQKSELKLTPKKPISRIQYQAREDRYPKEPFVMSDYLTPPELELLKTNQRVLMGGKVKDLKRLLRLGG